MPLRLGEWVHMPRRLAAFRFICHLFLGLALATLAAATAGAKRIARLSPTEPIFTEKAFLEKSIEFDASWSSQDDGDTIDLGSSIHWVFWDRLQLDMDLPVGIRIPDDSATVGSLSDIEFGAQALVYGGPGELLDFFSVRAEVDAPTGDRSKGIGGDGSWSVALLPARYFTLTEAVPDLEITLELAYTQQIRLDREGAELAREPGFSHTLEKELDWNVAFTQKYFDGQVRPVFELLGTTTVDAIDEDDEGTILELAAGFWLIPHADEHLFSAFSYGLGFRVPVTSRNEDQGAVMLVIEHSFD